MRPVNIEQFDCMRLFKYIHIYLLLLFSMTISPHAIGQTEENNRLYSDNITAYIFLLDQCLISQYYTLPLNDMYTEFGDQISFQGIFPTEGITEKRIKDFGAEYNLKFTLKKDIQDLSTQLNVSVTPEVVLYDEINQTILYQGRIDNSYASLGRKRRHVTTNEMLSAIRAILSNKEIRVKYTEAVGCFLNKKKQRLK